MRHCLRGMDAPGRRQNADIHTRKETKEMDRTHAYREDSLLIERLSKERKHEEEKDR